MILEKLEKLKSEAKDFCKDKSQPIEERWKTVLKMGDASPSTIDFGFPVINEVMDNNDLYLDRWDVYSVDDILDKLLNDEYLTNSDIEKYKEYCCNNFIGKIQYSIFLSL